MYKILHFDGLGVGGRQNELIELALTHRFDTIELDMSDLLGRHETMGKDFACQFLLSAKKISLGTFTLPVDFGCSDEEYAKFLANADTIVDLASTLGCKVCLASISPTSDVPFQENFERHRIRLIELAQKFEASGLRIGLGLNATKANVTPLEHKFVQSAEEILTLTKTVGHPNVGLCLDTFEWQVGSGGMDQLSELDIASLTEVRLGDLSDQADIGNVKPGDRIMPGESSTTLAVKLLDHLRANNYEGAVSVATNQAMFAGSSRDKTVAAISNRVDRLIANEPLVDPEVPTDSAEETTEEEAAKAAT